MRHNQPFQSWTCRALISSSLFAGPRLPMVRIDAEQCRSAPVFEADWRRQATCVFVFPGTGCHRHPVEPKKGWQRTCKAVGIQGARIHDLRRTMGSRQAKTGAGLPVIGKNLNHKNQARPRFVRASTSTRYARPWRRPPPCWRPGTRRRRWSNCGRSAASNRDGHGLGRADTPARQGRTRAKPVDL